MSDKFKEITLDLASFVSMMGESIAEAKAKLDESSLNLLEKLKENVSIPVITNTVKPVKDANGNVIDTEVVSTQKQLSLPLLALGIKPTFYEFQRTEIEVSMDLTLEEEETESTGRQKKRRLLKVDTKKVRQQRRINQQIKAFSRLKIEMVPVPSPNNLPDFTEVITEE